MDSIIINETQLIAEIDKLREQFPNTQDLYREVCALLFFRYGTAPTANKLYQLVRKGSMSAPAEALNKFWSDLREKSRVRIEHPDLPESLKTAAGDLTAALWSAAQEAAADSLAALRDAAQAETDLAKSMAEQARLELAALQEEAEQRRMETESLRHENLRLQQVLAADRATREAIEAQLDKAHGDIAAHQEAHESARRYYADEMEKLRTAIQLDKERFASAERHFLQEVENERQASAKLQKELDFLRQENGKLQDQSRNDATALQGQLGDLRQQLGLVEGKLHSTVSERDQLANDLRAAHIQTAESAARLAQVGIELDMWRHKAEKSESAAAERKARSEARTPRKARLPTLE